MKIRNLILIAIAFSIGLYVVINNEKHVEPSDETSITPILQANESKVVDSSDDPQIETEEIVDWLQPGDFLGQPAWGIKHGIVVGIYPADLGGIGGGDGGPKGLFRIHKDGPSGLAWVNFISVEPETSIGKGLSELEETEFIPLNYTCIFESEEPAYDSKVDVENAAYFSRLEGGAEQLNLLFLLTPYQNGAKIHLSIHIRSDRPDELEIRLYTQDNSEKVEQIRMSSTAGNFNHLRMLWLKDKVVDARALYKEYEEKITPKEGSDYSWDYSMTLFTPVTRFPAEQLIQDDENSIIVPVTRSGGTEVFWNEHFTYYNLTQYWKKYDGYYGEQVYAAVNARKVFWHSLEPIPGGICYENFELNEPFIEGQRVWFGVSINPPR